MYLSSLGFASDHFDFRHFSDFPTYEDITEAVAQSVREVKFDGYALAACAASLPSLQKPAPCDQEMRRYLVLALRNADWLLITSNCCTTCKVDMILSSEN